MALSDCPLFILGGGNPCENNYVTIDANDEWTGWVFPVTKSGTITHVCWATDSVNTGATVDVRLETVSSGLPSGTLVKASANKAQVVADGDDYAWFETELTATVVVPTDVALGTVISAIVKNPGSSPGNMRISHTYQPFRVTTLAYLYAVSGIPTAAIAANATNFALKYSDSSYFIPLGGDGFKRCVQQSISTSTTPEQMGNRFKLDKAFRSSGFYISYDIDQEITVKLLSGASTEEKTVTIANSARTATTMSSCYVPWPSPFEGAADTYYRIVVYPGTGTNTTFKYLTYNSEALKNQANYIPTGCDIHLTTGKDPSIEGDWTNTTTAIGAVQPVIDQLEFPAAGSGGGPVFGDRTGGLR